MAPEILELEKGKVYTQKVDVWSLGVLLFIMLSGLRPFSANYGTPVFEQIKEARFSFQSDRWEFVSQTAKDLICKLLTKESEERPSAIELFDEEWLNDCDMVANAHAIMGISSPNGKDEGNGNHDDE